MLTGIARRKDRHEHAQRMVDAGVRIFTQFGHASDRNHSGDQQSIVAGQVFTDQPRRLCARERRGDGGCEVSR